MVMWLPNAQDRSQMNRVLALRLQSSYCAANCTDYILGRYTKIFKSTLKRWLINKKEESLNFAWKGRFHGKIIFLLARHSMQFHAMTNPYTHFEWKLVRSMYFRNFRHMAYWISWAISYFFWSDDNFLDVARCLLMKSFEAVFEFNLVSDIWLEANEA